MSLMTRVAFACVMGVSASAAMGAAQSSATISDITFKVIDLNTQDGVSFTYVGGKTSLSISATDNVLGESDSASSSRNGMFAINTTFGSTLDNVMVSASLKPEQIQLVGGAAGVGTSYSASASTGGTQPYYYYNGEAVLTLSPQSMVIITATADVFAAASNPQACSGYYYYSCNPSESASASASMGLNYAYNFGTGNTSYNFSDSVSVSAIARGAYTEQVFLGYDYSQPYSYYYYTPIYQYIVRPEVEESKSGSRSFTAVFINTSNVNQTAAFYLNASISGNATTPADTFSIAGLAANVPEPETNALMLAGLGLVFAMGKGRLARRRAQ